MKRIVLLTLLATSLATSAHALIVGADIGYLTDAKEAYYSGRIGHAFSRDASLSHQVEVEIGYTLQKEDGNNIKGEFIPVTINYRAETTAANKLGFYFGAGAGFSRTKIKAYSLRDSGTSLALQGFGGVSYQATPSVALHAGVKYIWIDDLDLFGISLQPGDDVALTAGVSIRF